MDERNLGGRPTKFTPERRQAILESISKCIPNEIAALANGICEDTLYEWIKHGKDDLKKGIDSEFAQFSEAIKKIEQERIDRHISKLNCNVERWQADAWILERRWPKHYGQNAVTIELEKKVAKLEELLSKK